MNRTDTLARVVQREERPNFFNPNIAASAAERTAMQNTLTSKEYIEQFGRVLFKTRHAERSNSVRARLYNVLCDTFSAHHADVPGEISVRNAIRDTSPFTTDEREFRGTVSLVIRSLVQSRNVGEISRTLYRLACEARDERVLESVMRAVERKNERDRGVALVADMLSDCEWRDRLARI